MREVYDDLNWSVRTICVLAPNGKQLQNTVGLSFRSGRLNCEAFLSKEQAENIAKTLLEYSRAIVEIKSKHKAA